MSNHPSNQVVKWKHRHSRETPKEIVAMRLGVDHLSTIAGIEDLTFQIALFLVPKRRNPSSMNEWMSNLMFVSKSWYKAFSLVRAQMRHDYLTQQLSSDDQWLYHKILYIPGPPEGRLRIFRSHVNEACKEALHEYRFHRSQDENAGASHDRRDSRPDYYFKAHRESPKCLELVPPKVLSWTFGKTFSIENEIEYDQKPRLISEYCMIIDDVNGIEHPGSEKSKEGRLNLGFHEIISVREPARNTCLNPRPPLNGQGQDSSEFLRACNAKALDAPRWIKFAHAVGEDRCRMFINKNLLPMIGSRPTGNTWPG
jgi:hypothetical protein